MIACVAPSVAPAQTASADGATLLTPHDLGVLGLSTLGAIGVSSVDVKLARIFADTGLHNRHPTVGQWSRRASIFTETVYMISGGLVYLVAQHTGDRTTEDVALHTTAAVFGGAMSIQVVRGAIGRARPFVDDTIAEREHVEQYDFHLMRGFRSYDYRSFPSMHAMASFAVASALSQEMRYRDAPHRKIVSPLLYTFATMPAASRLFLNEHWASDIALGVVIGVVAGQRAVGYTHAHPDNRFDHRFLRAGIMRSGGHTSLLLAPGST